MSMDHDDKLLLPLIPPSPPVSTRRWGRRDYRVFNKKHALDTAGTVARGMKEAHATILAAK
ncbi:hypothetical protein E4U41_006788 [Claviceps citrina]|nr:hypothetical protein E4U41_006788 [Claviceps citrina]